MWICARFTPSQKAVSICSGQWVRLGKHPTEIWQEFYFLLLPILIHPEPPARILRNKRQKVTQIPIIICTCTKIIIINIFIIITQNSQEDINEEHVVLKFRCFSFAMKYKEGSPVTLD